MYWDDLLTTTGARQEALDLTSWLKPLCQRLGFVTNLEILVNLVSGYHISGIDLDTLVGLFRPYDKRVTNGYA